MSRSSLTRPFTQHCRFILLTLALYLVLTQLPGCGFQLRGNQLLPSSFSSVEVSCKEDTEILCQKVKKAFSTQGIEVSSDGKMKLSLESYNEDKRAVSITTNAVASEYQLTQTVKFSLSYLTKGSDIISLINHAETQSNQSYRYDDNSVLGKSREESQIRNTLEDKLTFQLLKRIAPFDKKRIAEIANKQNLQATP